LHQGRLVALPTFHLFLADLFQAALCSFGCLGVVTGVIIQAVTAFDLDARETSDRLGNVLSNLTSRVRSVPYYRFWWFPHTDRVMEWKAVPLPPNRAKRTSTVHPYTLRWILYPLVRLHNWFWTTLIGFHFYQFLLYLGIYIPRIIPWINFFWHLVYFSSAKRVIDRSDKVFNFDCLFQQ
jgi:L-gulonolactone oxidase